MSMSVSWNGFGLKDSQRMFPFAADESWPSQPWKVSGDVIVGCETDML
jgi:hypothetical protein